MLSSYSAGEVNELRVRLEELVEQNLTLKHHNTEQISALIG